MPRASKSTEGDEPLSKQSLKAAVWYTVTKIAQEEELSLPFAASEHFVATLAEVIFQQALSLGKDLERFAKHAGRLTINADDVKLAARRNEPLFELLTTSAQAHGLTLAELKAESGAGPSKGKAKAVKAPRLAAPKKEKEKEAKEAKSRSTSAEGKGKGKGKGKARAREEDDDVEMDEVDESEPELAGGFVKASALAKAGGSGRTKGRGKAVVADSEEDDGDVGGDSGEESEEVGSKREKGSKADVKGAKRRKTAV